MSQFDDLPPPRRPLFFPVVIATVLLAIIGMSAGFVLGSRHVSARATEPPTPAAIEPTADPTAEPTVAGIKCPREMHDTARRLGYDVTLTQVLKVRASSTGMTVWICRDGDGALFYQANSGGDDKEWVEGKTALFLHGVVKTVDAYEATAKDGNVFSVNEQRLVIVKKGKAQSWDVEPE